MPTKKEEIVKTPEELAIEEKSLERQAQEEEKSLKQQLKERPKKMIHIPEDQNNPNDVVSVTWNGITYAIPRGESFEVPDVIADIWTDSYKQTQAVNKRIRESTQKEITIM
jgi:hypothetical protein